jgi:hypothetical protein
LPLYRRSFAIGRSIKREKGFNKNSDRKECWDSFDFKVTFRFISLMEKFRFRWIFPSSEVSTKMLDYSYLHFIISFFFSFMQLNQTNCCKSTTGYYGFVCIMLVIFLAKQILFSSHQVLPNV